MKDLLKSFGLILVIYFIGVGINHEMSQFDWYRAYDQEFTAYIRDLTNLNIGRLNY